MKAPLVRASLVKRRYTKYLALPFLPRSGNWLAQIGGTVFLDPSRVCDDSAHPVAIQQAIETSFIKYAEK